MIRFLRRQGWVVGPFVLFALCFVLTRIIQPGYGAGDFGSLVRAVLTISLADPNSPVFMNEMGLAFLDLKRYDSARFWFGRGVKQDPLNAQLYNNLARAQIGLKQYDSARYMLQRAMELDPDNSSVWT